MEREFKGIWIPGAIYLDEKLKAMEKLILIEIDSLSNLGECYASNDHFAKFCNLSKDRVSKLISSLSKKGYIEIQLLYKKESKEVEKRVITTGGYRRKQLYPLPVKVTIPIVENNQDINTITNTINKEDKISKEIYTPTKKNIDKRKEEFYTKVAEFKDLYTKETLRSFYDYWTETNDGGNKMRFEMNKTFEISKRLAMWKRNELKFTKFTPQVKETVKTVPAYLIEPDGRKFTYDKETNTKTYL